MLNVFASGGSPNCQGVSRRDFLRIGTLGLGGLTLPWLLQQRASADVRPFVRNKSIVLLFLSGGASHIETFNPNMNASAPYCSLTGAVSTSLPGVGFGGTFPLLSRHANQMAVVRSFQHPIGGHVQAIVHVLTGGTDVTGRGESGYSMGSVSSRIRGANHPVTGMPTFSLLNSDEVDPQYRSERGRVEQGSRAGVLGDNYRAFNPAGKGDAVANMQLNMPMGRLTSRRQLLQQLDEHKQHVERLAERSSIDEYRQQAFDVILGGAAEAFDLSREQPKTVARYDTSDFRVGKKQFRASQLGRHLLTARRLVEAGCGFVTVHSAGWDMHADGNNPGIITGMEMLGRPVDKAVSAFLEDLAQRGLSDDVLLIITGDFGRTPKVNKNGGRDHWSNLSTLALAGGGLAMGQVIGRAAKKNDAPLTEPITVKNLLATVMHTQFDIAELRLVRGMPRDLIALTETAKPIQELF